MGVSTWWYLGPGSNSQIPFQKSPGPASSTTSSTGPNAASADATDLHARAAGEAAMTVEQWATRSLDFCASLQDEPTCWFSPTSGCHAKNGGNNSQHVGSTEVSLHQVCHAKNGDHFIDGMSEWVAFVREMADHCQPDAHLYHSHPFPRDHYQVIVHPRCSLSTLPQF